MNRQEQIKLWRENNKEHLTEYARQYRENNKEKMKEISKRYYLNHHIPLLIKNRKRRKINKEKQARQSRAKTAQLRLICLKHYGGNIPRCKRCGLCDTRYLVFDHIENDGYIDRLKHGTGRRYYAYLIDNNFPANLQILCSRCNLDKMRKY